MAEFTNVMLKYKNPFVKNLLTFTYQINIIRCKESFPDSKTKKMAFLR